MQRGDLFVALRGENFDAHDFLSEAVRRGAAAAIAERVPENLPQNFPVIRVENSLAALQQMARHYRSSLTAIKVVAITGSNGKTSTKDFAAAVIGARFSVVKTEGNLNNHIGLPLTILCADDSHDVAVFEIGMNHPGEISPLAKIAQPDLAIITNIGIAHIEFMKTREAIAQEKGALAEALKADGCLILNANDEYAASISKRTKARTVLAGIGAGEIQADESAIDFKTGEFTVSEMTGTQKSLTMKLAVPARHMVSNALLAVAAGRALGLTLEECANGLEKVSLTKGRLERKNIRGIEVLDDTYNANPDSMKAALQTLSQMAVSGRRIAVLGKMGELGAESESGHRMVGVAAGDEKIDCVIGVGTETAQLVVSAAEHGAGETHHVANNEEASKLLRALAKPGDAVLVKGSRAARMETIVEELAA